MTNFKIRMPVHEDAQSWLTLAREVEHLFGPMADIPEFQSALHGAIESQTAICATSEPNEYLNTIVGGIVISPENNSIEWFAVSTSARGAGLGRKLLHEAINHLDSNRPIRVQTFDKSCLDGLPARNLYLAFGFCDVEPKEPTPTGIPTVIMEKQPCPNRG